MKRWSMAVLLMLVFVLGISNLTPLGSVEAGITETTLSADTFNNKAYWYCPGEDVLIDNGKLIFDKKSTEDTKFVSRTNINASKESGEFLIVDCSVKFTALPSGKKFVIGLGVQDMEPRLGDEKSIELAFTNTGGVKLAVSAFKEAGKETVLCNQKSCGISVGTAAQLRLSINGEGVLKVSVNGATVYSGTLPVDGSGKVAFMQTGGCGAEISGLKIVGKDYDRPQNTNVFEDFEQGIDISKIEYPNTRVIGLEWRYPKTVAVKEYNGNKVLMFVNAGGYFFTTKYRYSNFEMTFDIPFAQRQQDMTIDDGTRFFRDFGLCFGIPGDGDADYYGSEAADKILFSRTKVTSDLRKEFESSYPYLQGDKFQPFSVKLSVIDGVVTVGTKLMSAKNFETLGQYTIAAGSPTGYIRFAIPEYATMAIDNLKITNLDINPDLITTTYQNGIVTFEDAKYEPFERVYKEDKEADNNENVEGEQTDKENADVDSTDTEQVLGEENKMPIGKRTISWYLLIPSAGLLSIVIFVVSLAIATRKGKTKKEVVTDET